MKLLRTLRLPGTPWWLALLSLAGCSQETRAPDLISQYQSAGTALALHVFRPTHAAGGRHPTILFFHGGAWQQGGPGQFHGQCAELASHGYLCISAAYRLARSHGTSPADAVADARAALRHVREHAAELGADKQRLVLAGGSAGGHLAALLATGQQDGPAAEAVAALVLFNPMLNLAPGRPDHELVAPQWRSLSPYHQLHSRLPPTLILLGDRDREVPVSTAEAFCARAQQLGGVCRLDVARNQGHGFFNRSRSPWHYHRTLHSMRAFLQQLGIAPR